MTRFYPAIFSTLVCSLHFAACDSEGDDTGGVDGGTDTNPDTYTDTASDSAVDSNNGTECGEGADTSDYEFKELFECADCVAVPADVFEYKDYSDGGEVTAFFDGVWEMAMKWFDERCLEECEITPPEVECLIADCITDAGAEIEYSYKESKGYLGDYDVATVINESVTVTPPGGGEPWEQISASKEMHSESSVDVSYISVTHYFLEWNGTLHPAWPSDYQVNLVIEKSADDVSDYRSIDWSHETCDLISEWTSHSHIELTTYRLVMNENTVNVTSRDDKQNWNGWVNNECVGKVDPETWEIIGECVM